MKKLLLFLPVLVLTLLLSPAVADAQDRRRGERDRDDGYDRVYREQRRGERGREYREQRRGKRNLNDGYDRYYNERRGRRGFERREYEGRRRYYRDGQYYYRSRDGYYPYGSRPRRGGGGISITF